VFLVGQPHVSAVSSADNLELGATYSDVWNEHKWVHSAVAGTAGTDWWTWVLLKRRDLVTQRLEFLATGHSVFRQTFLLSAARGLGLTSE
jgi:hypothetical protein